MDPAGIGALIGFGVLFCFMSTATLYDRFGEWYQRWQKYREQKQPLLQVTKENPLLVRSNSKQFKIKELVTPK